MWIMGKLPSVPIRYSESRLSWINRITFSLGVP